MEGCKFCDIAEHGAPAAMIWEDRDTLAFLDIHPIARGHTLVIPRAHYANLFELDEKAIGPVMSCAQRVACALTKTLKPDGLNVLQSNGKAAGQTIFHFHFHLVPRWHNDGLFLPRHAFGEAERGVLTELASALRQEL